jgi:hypothetical protein
MGIKTPKYFKALSIIDATGQEHHGILVERILFDPSHSWF